MMTFYMVYIILAFIFLYLAIQSLINIKRASRRLNNAKQMNDKLKELTMRGMEVFESKQKFGNWLVSNIAALGNRKPIDMINTPEEIDELLTILGRIEHGVYS